MTVNSPMWGLCIQLGVIPVAVFLGFRVSIVADIKGRREEAHQRQLFPQCKMTCQIHHLGKVLCNK